MKNKFILSALFFSLCITACRAQVKATEKDSNTTTMSTYSRTSSYASTITEQENTEIFTLVKDVLKAPSIEENNSKIWFFSNDNERFEVSLHSDEITIEFKSNTKDSEVEKMVGEMIEQINQIIDAKNEN